MPSRTVRLALELESSTTTRDRVRLLDLARRVARKCARGRASGFCTVDDVFERVVSGGHNVALFGRIASQVFRGRDWVATPFRVRSRRAANRGREIKVWCLVGEDEPRKGEWPDGLGILVRPDFWRSFAENGATASGARSCRRRRRGRRR